MTVRVFFALAVTCSLGLSAADEDRLDLILKKLVNLERQVALQQETIRRQDKTIQKLHNQMTQLDDKVSAVHQSQQPIAHAETTTTVSKGLPAQNAAPTITLGPSIDRLKFTGDLLLRYEQRDRDDDTPNSGDDRRMQRFRTRLRLGGIWTNSAEDWEIGVGLATGNFKGASSSAVGTGSNDTWNEDSVWENGDVGLDYAYAQHHWGDVTFTVGQQKNPFKTTYILFDSDLRPTGATFYTEREIGGLGAFITLGAYNVRLAAENEDMADMIALQVGLKQSIGETGSALLALGFYRYDAATSEAFFQATGNDDYSWQLLDIYAEAGNKFGPVKLTGYGEYVTNLGANNDNGSQFIPNDPPAVYLPDYEPDENNVAWVAGLKAKYKRLSLDYSYAHIEGDSVPAFQTDCTFANLLADTNVAGHVLKLKCSITPHFYVGANMFLTTWIEDDDQQFDNSNIYHFDLGYKF